MTVTETHETYNVQDKNDENYIEIILSNGGKATYSYWDETFVSIPLNYTVSGNSVRVYSGQADLTLSYDATEGEGALVLSRPLPVGQNETYTVNIYFRK